MDRRIIALIWLAGLLLMVAIYAIGPQNFLTALAQFITAAMERLSDVIDALTQRAFEVVRAGAIAMYAVFVVLAVLAMQRGLRAGGMLLVVSVVFALLVRSDWYDPGTKWLVAAVLTVVAALVLTKRLILAPPRRDPADPWGIAARAGGQSAAPRTPPAPPP